ncbi:TIGR02594 family protein [Enterobacter hormaechei]|uniref:TIGR02594 family protein n=1 Tax=Enterobacter hormaechei TaxID=158836 RepID=UPI0034D32D5F
MDNEPKWLAEARKHLGLHEIKGPQNAAEIVQFFKDIKRGGIKDDETPWCAAFVGAMLERSGIRSTRFESAKSYLEWGEPLQSPALGCVAVLTRDGGGHVGFVVGRAPNGDLMLLGGNQGDQVCIRAFAPSRVTGYRWPVGVPDIPQGISELAGARSTS